MHNQKIKFARVRRYCVFTLLVFASVTAIAAEKTTKKITITVDPASQGPTINRHIFGQFAEHLGRGIYEGVWVGPDSKIPNTRGIRNDVVEALKALKVPNVRWPGGCYADDYHWRDGIGKAEERRTRINASWGGRIEPNTFGTHEYFDLLQQIGADAFISANVGSGTVQEAADWLEYLTATGSSLAKERARNGHPEPYEVAFWGIGNEAWGCGGPLTAEEYLTRLKLFSNASANYNPDVVPKHVAVGPDGKDYGEYTEVIMKAWSKKTWAWGIEGLSLHRYTRNGWPPNIIATDFTEEQYAKVLHETIGMEGFIERNAAIMDKYDPKREVAILVDEWGTWYAPTEGSEPGFLEQQNSQRDAIVAALNFNIFMRHAERVRGANIAQMVNVLQAMILTDKEKMLLTPTYHAFRLYVPFQDATRLAIDYDKGEYQSGKVKLPRVDAVAARGEDGRIWVAITNVDPKRAAAIDLALKGQQIASVRGDTLAGPAIDTVNTFDSPREVSPEPAKIEQDGGRVTVQVAPHSVTVVALEVK